MLTAYRRAERDNDKGIISNLGITVRWYRFIRNALAATIQKADEDQQYQRFINIRTWAALAEESEFAKSTLVPLARSRFGFALPSIRISQ
jgi:hypothetical protein